MVTFGTGRPEGSEMSPEISAVWAWRSAAIEARQKTQAEIRCKALNLPGTDQAVAFIGYRQSFQGFNPDKGGFANTSLWLLRCTTDLALG